MDMSTEKFFDRNHRFSVRNKISAKKDIVRKSTSRGAEIMVSIQLHNTFQYGVIRAQRILTWSIAT